MIRHTTKYALVKQRQAASPDWVSGCHSVRKAIQPEVHLYELFLALPILALRQVGAAKEILVCVVVYLAVSM